jgi:magnesium transporter
MVCPFTDGAVVGTTTHTIMPSADDVIYGGLGRVKAPRDRKGDQTVSTPSTCHVVHKEQVGELHLIRDNLERLLASGSFFWIDLPAPKAEDFAVLRDVFQFHPLALEDSEHFGQRAKLEDYDDFVFLVIYGAVPDEDRLVEVHCFYSERFLITVHRDDAPAFVVLRDRYQKRRAPMEGSALMLYRIIDALVDSFFPILADFDDRIDELETQIFLHASNKQLQEIFAMKRLLVGIRKAVTPQRDLFASLLGGVTELSGMTTEAERHFRDVYDHLIRLTDLVDTYRDLLTSSMDVFLSTVSKTYCRYEAAGRNSDHLLAAFIHYRILWPKLRLAGGERRQLAGVHRIWRRIADRGRRDLDEPL